jgi:hypothetical protein
MSRGRFAAIAAAFAALATAGDVICHPPFGDFLDLESPCYTTLLQDGNISIRHYSGLSGSVPESVIMSSQPVMGDPISPPEPDVDFDEYLSNAIFDYAYYITPKGNEAGVNVSKSSPFIVTPGPDFPSVLFNLTIMLPTADYPNGPKAAPQPNTTNMPYLSVQRFAPRTIAAYYFKGGIFERSVFEKQCAKLVDNIPAGWKIADSAYRNGHAPAKGLRGDASAKEGKEGESLSLSVNYSLAFYSRQMNKHREVECWVDVERA